MPSEKEKRLIFHEKLCSIIGSKQVYFQPPESVRMKYPAIVYSRTDIKQRRADNRLYLEDTAYRVTYMYTNPDDETPQKLAALPYSRYNSHFVRDNLYHDVFIIFNTIGGTINE